MDRSRVNRQMASLDAFFDRQADRIRGRLNIGWAKNTKKGMQLGRTNYDTPSCNPAVIGSRNGRGIITAAEMRQLAAADVKLRKEYARKTGRVWDEKRKVVRGRSK